MHRGVIWYLALALVILALIFALAAVTVLGWRIRAGVPNRMVVQGPTSAVTLTEAMHLGPGTGDAHEGMVPPSSAGRIRAARATRAASTSAHKSIRAALSPWGSRRRNPRHGVPGSAGPSSLERSIVLLRRRCLIDRLSCRPLAGPNEAGEDHRGTMANRNLPRTRIQATPRPKSCEPRFRRSRSIDPAPIIRIRGAALYMNTSRKSCTM